MLFLALPDYLGHVIWRVFFTLQIIRTLLQPRRSFVLVGWSLVEGTSHFLVRCADRLGKKTRRTARRSPNHRSHYYCFLLHERHFLERKKLLCSALLLQQCCFAWLFTQWTSEDKWGCHREELRLLTASLGLGRRQRSLLSLSLSLYTSLESHAKIRDCNNYIDFVFHYYFKM